MEGSTKIVNFMTPEAGVLVQGCVHIRHISENALFLKKSQAYNRETKCIGIMTKEVFTKIVNFMTLRAKVLFRGMKIFFSPPRHKTDKLSE